MFAQFRYLDGPRAGETREIGNDFATFGRHPTSDVGFDAEMLEVSVRHAAVFKQGGGFLIRDLGSTNGTFVNEHRVRGDRPLEPNDVIRLGPGGPKVEFTITAAIPIGSKTRPPQPTAPPLSSTEIYRPRARTTAQVPIAAPAPRAGQRKWRRVAVAIVIGGAAAVSLVVGRREARRVIDQQRAALLTRVDDHLNRLGQATTPLAAVAAALAGARSDVASIRRAAQTADLTAGGVDSLDRALIEALRAHEPLLGTARFDAAAATQRGRGSVAVIIAEGRHGQAQSGTGFVVKHAGDTVWLVTTRSLVFDSSGRRAVRIALIFNGARVAQLATLIRAADSADVALLAAIGRATAPAAASLSDSLASGQPVAAVGFPPGADSLGDWRKSGVSATVVTGTVGSATPVLVEIEGYRRAGPRGAPLFTASGEVVGMVTKSTAGRWLAIPSRVIRRLLEGGKP